MFNLDDITNKHTTKNIIKNGHICQITGTVGIKHLNDSKRFIEHSGTMKIFAIILMIITQQEKEKF